MRNIKIFAKTYWQHARNVLEFILFVLDLVLIIVSIIGVTLGWQVSFAVSTSIALMFLIIIVAAYRTWLYQYNETQRLIDIVGKEIEFDDLDDIQKAILRGMSSEDDKRIIPMKTGGAQVFFTGIRDTDEKYDSGEISAAIVELQKMDILWIDGYSPKNHNPIYKPTSLGFKILKALSKA